MAQRASAALMQAALDIDPPAVDNGHRTARRAVDLLCRLDDRYRCPTRAERTALMVAYAGRGLALHAAAFDAVQLDEPVDLADPVAIAAGLDAITVCEIKSTNQHRVGDDLKGYFFNITAAKLLTAQGLGRRYRFVFVNTATGTRQEMGLSDVLGKARTTYPAWHIRF